MMNILIVIAVWQKTQILQIRNLYDRKCKSEASLQCVIRIFRHNVELTKFFLIALIF